MIVRAHQETRRIAEYLDSMGIDVFVENTQSGEFVAYADGVRNPYDNAIVSYAAPTEERALRGLERAMSGRLLMHYNDMLLMPVFSEFK